MINTFNIFSYNIPYYLFVFFILAIHLIFIEDFNLFIYIFGRITIITEFFLISFHTIINYRHRVIIVVYKQLFDPINLT